MPDNFWHHCGERSWVQYCTCQEKGDPYTHTLHVWNIHLQNWSIFGVNVGIYTIHGAYVNDGRILARWNNSRLDISCMGNLHESRSCKNQPSQNQPAKFPRFHQCWTGAFIYIYIHIRIYIYIHIHIYIYTYIYSLGQKTTSTTGPLKRVSRVPVPFDKPLLVALLLILLLRSLKSPFFLGKRLEVFDGADMIFMRCSNAIWMLGCWLCVVTLLKSEIVVYTYTISCHHISSSTCTWHPHTPISGWWFEPLWKILANWDDYSQYMGKTCFKPPTRYTLYIHIWI